MTHRSSILTFVVGALLVPAGAIAGWKTSEPVSITTVSSSTVRLRGSLIGAHNSADTVQYIGCQNRYDFSYCMGRDSTGRTVMCSTGDPGKMAVMASLTPASYLDVTMVNGTCTTLEMSTGSRWMSPVRQPIEALP